MCNSLKIAGFLSTLKSKVKHCPCCSEAVTFSFHDEILYIQNLSGDKALPVICGTCSNCGYILQFDATVLQRGEYV